MCIKLKNKYNNNSHYNTIKIINNLIIQSKFGII